MEQVALLLLCLSMQRMLLATRAIFIELEASWIVAAIFLSCVISLLTIVALQRDDGANTFF